MKSMRNLGYIGILAGMVLALCCTHTSAYALLLQEEYVPGEVIVSFDPGITESYVEYLADELGFSMIRKLRLQKCNTFLVEIGDGQSEEDLISLLSQNVDVLYAELNLIGSIPRPPGGPVVIDLEPMPTDENGQIILEYVLPPGRELLPYPPRFDGTLPLEGGFDYFEYMKTFRVIAPSSDVSSDPVGVSVVVVPEPTTMLLLGMGALAIRKRKRS